MKWNNRTTLPDVGRKVLTYSPKYEGSKQEDMRLSLLDGGFVKYNSHIKLWAYADDLIKQAQVKLNN